MKKAALIFLCSLLLIASCSNPAATAGDTTTYSVDGSVQKGPFQLGSAITIQTLNKNLEPTGSVFNTLTSDDFGGFSLHSKIPERYVEIQAKGFYFNECAGTTPSAEITLRTYADLSSTNAVHINVLTTIAHQRIKALVGSGLTFEAAQAKAEKEILDVLGLSAVAGMHFSGYNLESNSSDAALLLAISSTFQQGRSVASLQLFLADLATDLADGFLDPNFISQIRASAGAVTPAAVIANLQSYYSGRGKNITVPDFSSFRNMLRTAGGVLGMPIADKPAGTYLSPLSVNLTAPVGSIIRYSTDSTTDLTTGGTDYDGVSPLTFTATGSTPNNVTIRAIAILNGVCSAVTTVNYIVREGWIGSDYVDVTPGHYIEYDFSGFSYDGTTVTEKTHAIIQPGSSTVPYFTSIATTNSIWDCGYMYPAKAGYVAGSMGGSISAGNSYASFFYYVFHQLPSIVYSGSPYTSRHEVTFTPSSIESWDSFTDVFRVDFDTTNFVYPQFGSYTQTALRGKGYAIYAKGTGLVYFEITHSDDTGNNFGKKETLTYSTSDTAKLVSFHGSLKVGGGDGTGYTVAPCSFIEDLPDDAYSSIASGSNFTIKQYIAPGSCFPMSFFPTGTKDETRFRVQVTTSLPDVIELGEIGGVENGGLLTP